VRLVNFHIQLFRLQKIQLHYISNIKVENPVILAFNAKSVPGVNLKPLIVFYFDKLNFVLERDVKFASLLFCQYRCELFLGIHTLHLLFHYLIKVTYHLAHLGQDWICLNYHSLKHLNLLLKVDCFVWTLCLGC